MEGLARFRTAAYSVTSKTEYLDKVGVAYQSHACHVIEYTVHTCTCTAQVGYMYVL